MFLTDLRKGYHLRDAFFFKVDGTASVLYPVFFFRATTHRYVQRRVDHEIKLAVNFILLMAFIFNVDWCKGLSSKNLRMPKRKPRSRGNKNRYQTSE